MQEKKEDFISPCSVFMSFVDEEGFNRALEFENTVNNPVATENLHKLSGFLGKPGSPNEFEIKPASEPSDIIWENR